jgi:hypothetical protein
MVSPGSVPLGHETCLPPLRSHQAGALPLPGERLADRYRVRAVPGLPGVASAALVADPVTLYLGLISLFIVVTVIYLSGCKR